MKAGSDCTLARGFETWEKIYAQLSFLAIGIIGTIGVALVDWRWALVYAFIYLYGIMGVVMRHLVCPRCPHLHVYGDCLQAPPGLTRWLVRELKASPLGTLERLLFYGYFIFIPVFPLYWMRESPFLLVGFLVPVGTWYLGQFFRFCKRCRVRQCPFNRAHTIPTTG